MKAVIIILLILLLIVSFVLYRNNKYMRDIFLDNNTIVIGPKGTGKDLIFNNAMRLIKKHDKKIKLLASQPYGEKVDKVIDIKDLELGENTYNHFIQNKIHLIQKNNDFENSQVFISDGGIYLPSHEDNQLKKYYKSLPIMYAVSRHLYNMNIHVNVQAFNRIWKMLREQADNYIKALKSVKVGPFMFTKLRYYSEPQSAEQNILPLSQKGFAKRMPNKYYRAIRAEFEAKHGIIRDFWTIQKVKDLTYDTRYFHKKIFGISYADWEKSIKNIEN